MTLLTRFEIVLAKLGSCCCAARTTVRFSPHERTYGAGTVIRSPICHANGWRCRLPVPPLDFSVTYCRAPLVGPSLPTLTCFFLSFVRVLRGAVAGLFSSKPRAPNCSVCFGFLRELRGAPALYIISLFAEFWSLLI